MIHAVDLFLVAVGGALGGSLRHHLSGLVARRAKERFPWGTLVVNVSGALVIGVVMGSGEAVALVANTRVWTLIVTGFLGSYTTVSAFSLQTVQLARGGAFAQSAANVLLSFASCLAATGAGLLLARSVVGG